MFLQKLVECLETTLVSLGDDDDLPLTFCGYVLTFYEEGNDRVSMFNFTHAVNVSGSHSKSHNSLHK